MQASSAYNGVGIVKLMGRQSGYITMHATIASGQVDIVLIPEVSRCVILEISEALLLGSRFIILKC